MSGPDAAPADKDWQARRRDDAVRKAAALEASRAEESRQARVMLREFASAARAAGIPTESLRARGYDGSGRYRTNVVGWYLRRDRSVGIGTDGEFYVLSVQPSLWSRLTHAEMPPQDPPLILGKGGRDGESISLEDILRKRLEAGASWS